MIVVHILALIGYAACIFMLFGFSAAWFLAAINNTGEFNIGGAPNSFGTKVITWAIGLVLVFAWCFLLSFIDINVSFQ